MRWSFSLAPAPLLSAASDRVLGALLFRRDRGVMVPWGGRADWSSGLGEEDEFSCTRGGAAMISLPRAVAEGFDDGGEEDRRTPPGPPPSRKTCVGLVELPGARRPLSGGLIGQPAGRGSV